MKTIIKRKVFKMKKSIKDYLVILMGLMVLSFFFASCMSVEVQFETEPMINSSDKIDQELANLTNPFQFIDFEGLPLGVQFSTGQFFFETATKMSATEFQWSNSIVTTAGYVKVMNNQKAGGGGQDIWLNNIRLCFDFPFSPQKIILFYGLYGGNMNLMVNGDLRNEEDVMLMDKTNLGGVDIYVVEANVPGGVQGIILLDGTINALEIGGQEFFIDHVGFKN